MDSFEDFINYGKLMVETFVANMDEPDQDMYPTMFLWGFPEMTDTEPGMIIAAIDPRYLASTEGKNRLATTILPGHIIAKRARHFLYVSHVLALDRDQSDQDGFERSSKGESLTLNDDSRENIMVMAGTQDGSYFMTGALVLRDGEQPPALGKWGEFIPEVTGNVVKKESDDNDVLGVFFEPSMVAVVSSGLFEEINDPELKNVLEQFKKSFENDTQIDVTDE